MSHRSTQYAFPPADRARACLAGVSLVGENQYAVAYLFVKANLGEWPAADTPRPRVGDPCLGPHHMMDGVVRDYALLPDELHPGRAPRWVCAAWSTHCRSAGDATVTHATTSQHGSVGLPGSGASAAPRASSGWELGGQTATLLLTWDEVPGTIRETCDGLTDELGRARLGV